MSKKIENYPGEYNPPSDEDFKDVFNCDHCKKDVKSKDGKITVVSSDYKCTARGICVDCGKSTVIHMGPATIPPPKVPLPCEKEGCECKDFEFDWADEEEYVCKCGHDAKEHKKVVLEIRWSGPKTRKSCLKDGCYEEGKNHEDL